MTDKTLSSTDQLEVMWLTVAVTTLCFLSTSVNCDPQCEPSCAHCVESWLSHCNDCAYGYFFYTTKKGRIVCLKCHSGCVSCVGYTDCNECVPGKHGKGCRLLCGKGCVGGKCEQLTGKCACKDFYTGDNCKICVTGRYGDNCSQKCSEGCLSIACNSDSGACVCKGGYTGLKCTECATGRYGRSCQFKCSDGCLEGICDRQTGSCVCKAGFVGMKCDRCVVGRYSPQSNCSFLCPKNCSTCESDQICNMCNTGYYGSACDVLCPSNCLHGNCSKEEGKCHGGCKSGFNGERCELCQEAGKFGDGCTETCNGHCVTCSTREICDECKRGFYGSDCSKHCSSGCSENVCHQHNGTCTNGCKSGLTGVYCYCNSDGPCTNNENTKNNGNGYHPKTTAALTNVLFIFTLIIAP